MVETKNSGVYAIINKADCKMYIGSSCDLKTRKRFHLYCLENNKHKNTYLQSAYNKYGKDNFEFKVLKICKKENLLANEQILINKYNSTNSKCGYNLALTANRSVCSIETRKKISEKSKGRKWAEEERKNHIKALEVRKLLNPKREPEIKKEVNFSGVIEKTRREKRLTQKEASRIAGISVAIWNRAENGKSITLDSLKRMVTAVPELGNITLGELFNDIKF